MHNILDNFFEYWYSTKEGFRTESKEKQEKRLQVYESELLNCNYRNVKEFLVRWKKEHIGDNRLPEAVEIQEYCSGEKSVNAEGLSNNYLRIFSRKGGQSIIAIGEYGECEHRKMRKINTMIRELNLTDADLADLTRRRKYVGLMPYRQYSEDEILQTEKNTCGACTKPNCYVRDLNLRNYSRKHGHSLKDVVNTVKNTKLQNLDDALKTEKERSPSHYEKNEFEINETEF
jgi:hypothetical protein